MRRSLPTLSTALYGFTILSVALFTLVGGILLYDRIRSFQDGAISRAVEVRTNGAARAFTRALGNDWTDVTTIAGAVASDGIAGVRPVLDIVAARTDHVSWAGIADTSGRVIVASDGLLEGADVSARPWFLRGMQGDFAGDAHEAVLLQDALGSGGEPLRFVDMAAPVRDAAGGTIGVLGFHINAEWAASYLADMAEALDLDLMLVGAEGDIVASTIADMPQDLSLRGLQLAITGSRGSSYDTWPDGNRYFSYVLPGVTWGDMPSFGWRIVGRIDPATFLPTSPRELVLTILAALATAGLSLVIVSALFAAIFLRPLGVLALNAERISQGSDEYPLEITRTVEMQRLSTALARLQERRD